MRIVKIALNKIIPGLPEQESDCFNEMNCKLSFCASSAFCSWESEDARMLKYSVTIGMGAPLIGAARQARKSRIEMRRINGWAMVNVLGRKLKENRYLFNQWNK